MSMWLIRTTKLSLLHCCYGSSPSFPIIFSTSFFDRSSTFIVQHSDLSFQWLRSQMWLELKFCLKRLQRLADHRLKVQRQLLVRRRNTSTLSSIFGLDQIVMEQLSRTPIERGFTSRFAVAKKIKSWNWMWWIWTNRRSCSVKACIP